MWSILGWYLFFVKGVRALGRFFCWSIFGLQCPALHIWCAARQWPRARLRAPNPGRNVRPASSEHDHRKECEDVGFHAYCTEPCRFQCLCTVFILQLMLRVIAILFCRSYPGSVAPQEFYELIFARLYHLHARCRSRPTS